MLVLTRRIGEEIVIAGDIRVAVVAVNGQRVRLGITAPLSINVVRQELLAEFAQVALSKADNKPERPVKYRAGRRKLRSVYAPKLGDQPALLAPTSSPVA